MLDWIYCICSGVGTEASESTELCVPIVNNYDSAGFVFLVLANSYSFFSRTF